MKAGIEKLDTSLEEANITYSMNLPHEMQTWRRDLNDFAPRCFRSSAECSIEIIGTELD